MFAPSCSRDEGGLNPDDLQVREISVEANVAETKSVLSGASVKWEDGDNISLVFPHATAASHVTGLTTTIEDESQASNAKFKGTLLKEVTPENGYDKNGYAVYPATAVTADGSVSFTLPAEQTAAATVEKFAGVQSGLNLASGIVSLEEIVENGKTASTFRNACSVVRFTLAKDVTSMTITGTSNLAGPAPLTLVEEGDHAGRLMIDSHAAWNNGSKSVTLKPSSGDCFEDGTAYNLLVWPGEHSAVTLTLNYKEYGEVSKTSNVNLKFEPSKFYTLNFNASSEALVTELNGALDNLIGGLSKFEGDLEATEADVAALLAQIQSITVMTPYLNNSVYASYGVFNNGRQHLDLSLDYIVKPDFAAEALVKAFKADPTVVSGVLAYSKGNGIEVTDTKLTVNELELVEADVVGKYVAAKVSAGAISKDFYDGKFGASVALQVKSAKTDILSDFANLVPKSGTQIGGSFLKNVPAMPGASVVIPFNFAVADPDAAYTLEVTGRENVDGASVTYNKDFRTGNLTVRINESKPLESQRVTLTLTSGSGESKDVVSHEFTFVDNGARITFGDVGTVDYIGGEVPFAVTGQNITGGVIPGVSGSGAYYDQNNNVVVFSENTGAQRTVSLSGEATVSGLKIVKYLDVVQSAYGTSINQSKYHKDGDVKVLNNASSSYKHFNVVILGDGYTQKDLLKGGKFERNARTVASDFLSIEPVSSFQDRFNIMMVAYKSENEGPRLETVAESSHKTKFGTWYKGAGNTYVNYSDSGKNSILDIVSNKLGYTEKSDAFFRTIVILLVNTDEHVGSTDYPYMTTSNATGDGYGSFSIAMLTPNHMGSRGLVRHEACGHGFGRLGDEYDVNWYNTSLVNERHGYGFYLNVATNNTYWSSFTNAGYGSNEVTYDAYCGGSLYRSTAKKGIMWDNEGTFNAVSRHAIYQRIIKQSEGASAYSWSKFLEYDRRNR